MLITCCSSFRVRLSTIHATFICFIANSVQLYPEINLSLLVTNRQQLAASFFSFFHLTHFILFVLYLPQISGYRHVDLT